MTDTKKHQALRSYGRIKARKLKESSKDLIQTLLPKIAFNNPIVDKEIWLEIGFGGGEHLVYQAKNNPHIQFIGSEPFINGTAKLLQKISQNNIANITIHSGDVREIIPKLLPKSISKVFILFPDPWPKKKHNKRRIINNNFIEILLEKLTTNGVIRIATDHEDYKIWITEHFLNHPKFKFIKQHQEEWIRIPDDYVITKYHQKAINEGRVAMFIDLVVI